MKNSEILDFIYLDLPRLESFGSQLLEGLPESRTRSDEKAGEVTGEVSGGLPLVVKGTAGTRGVLSASSSVVSRDHHRLVVTVIDQLRERGFLHDSGDELPDGSFVLLNGQLQIADPALIGRFFGSAGDLQKAVQAFENPETQSASSTPAERRAAHRKRQASSAGWPPTQQTSSLKTILDFFAADTVRIRLLIAEETAAVGVVERDKFVEGVDRLVARHGQALGGEWSLLGQVNSQPPTLVPTTGSSSIFDMVETGGAGMLEAMKGLTSAGTDGLSVTALAIYRTIRATGE